MKSFCTALLLSSSFVAVAQQSSPTKSLDVRPFFTAVDKNRDGCASLAEWTAAGAPLSSYTMLKDSNGCVTLEKMSSAEPPPGIDANKDGKLTLSEMKIFDRKIVASESIVNKAEDALEIQNLMSRRMFYHSVGRNELELELWSKTRANEIRWAQNQGCWVGMKSLKVYYDDINRKMQAAQLKMMSEKNPAIKNIPENRGVGTTILHTLTTPIIEIARDGQSAKGVWYTPGIILSTNADGKTPEAVWMWERYGVDFIKENGRWAILHAQVFTDFGNPMGKPLLSQDFGAAAMGSEGQAGPGPGAEGLKVPGPDLAVKLFEEFSATRVPKLEPRLPEPYRSERETFEYADCSKKQMTIVKQR